MNSTITPHEPEEELVSSVEEVFQDALESEKRWPEIFNDELIFEKVYWVVRCCNSKNDFLNDLGFLYFGEKGSNLCVLSASSAISAVKKGQISTATYH